MGMPSRAERRQVIVAIATVTVLLASGAMALSVRASRQSNRVPLSAAPRPVTVVPAAKAQYRASRTYVGAVEPWIEASVGPQFISAYVLTVLVRPGARVAAGQVLATLDCGHASAVTRAAQMEARAIDARMRATADEAARVGSLVGRGFAAPNEAEQKSALSASELAMLQASKANLLKATLDVRDCVLRAPFAGEVATRSADPGAFVRPGAPIVSVVDRATVRVTADAPEKDFAAVKPGTLVRIDVLASELQLTAPIARTAPKADPRTRTIPFEVDVPDPERRCPVATTALVHVDVGAPVAATEVPIYAATLDVGKARLFTVADGVAHAQTLPVLGESGGDLFFAPADLPAGFQVVVEGRALLSDGDTVSAKVAALGDRPGPADKLPSRGGGYGRPL